MLCVIAKLDDSAAEKLASVRNAAIPGASKPLHGHITLATFTGDDHARFVRACRELLRDFPPFEVVYERIAVLEETSVIVAVPAESEELIAMHRCIADRFGASLDKWTGGGLWVPHTTLYFGPEADLHGLADRMAASFRPFSARIGRIEFSNVLEDRYEIVGRMDLST